MKYFCAFIFAGLLFSSSFSQNQPPQIADLSASFSYSDNKLTVRYEVSDPEGDSLEVFLAFSDNSGQTFLVDVSTAAGDIGFPVMPGIGKKITWDAPGPISNVFARVKLTVDDRKDPDIQSIVDQVDSMRLFSDLQWIEGIRHPQAGLAHLNEVKDSIEARFQGLGLDAYRQSMTGSGYNMENIIGLETGAVDMSRTYIIDGHFDGVSTSPAADDNGSAVAGVLEAARVLSPFHFKRNIRFIGFDQEEAGLLGSQFYVAQGIESYESIEGVLNFEMIGYYSDEPNTQGLPAGFNLLFPSVYNQVAADSFKGNFITNVSDPNSNFLKDAYHNAAATYVPELKVISFETPQPLITPDLLRSDHARFWEAGLPAVMLTDGADFRNPYYHTMGDTMGNLNFTFMHRVVKAAVATLAELAGIIHGDVAESEVGVMNTGIRDLLAECGLNLNQEEGRIILDINDYSCFDTRSNIQLVNLEGKILVHQQISPNTGTIEIPVRNVSAGIYLITIQNKKGEFTGKILLR